MEFTPRASWGAKFPCRNQRKFREKYICPRHLRRTLNKGTSNYENIHPSYRSGCHAWLEFVRLGAGGDHDHHDSRDHHGSAAGSDAADNDYSDHRLLAATFCSSGARVRNGCALFSYSAGVSISAFASSAWLTTGAIACNFSPSRKVRSFTPMALRPVSRISFTGVRTS